VCATTPLAEIQRFCELCDRYGFQALHAITPIGSDLWKVDCEWDNERIRLETGNRLFLDNGPALDYLLKRRDKDSFAVHGLWHTHWVNEEDVYAGARILALGGFDLAFDVPPFNERGGPGAVGLISSGAEAPRLEEYLDRPEDLPDAEIVYCHAWRFSRGPFTWEQLDRCLAALSTRLSLSAATAR